MSSPKSLITIWEPKSYLVLLYFLESGYSYPRKTLINADIELLETPKPGELTRIIHQEIKWYTRQNKKKTAERYSCTLSMAFLLLTPCTAEFRRSKGTTRI